MTHPTTDQSIRERLARRYCAAFWPNHPWDEAAEWQHDASWKAVDAILAELEEPSLHAELRQASKGMLTDVQLHGLWDCVRHIRDGGK